MSGRRPPKKNPEAMSWKNGVKLYNTQWTTIRQQLEIIGRKRAPTETEKFFAPLELAAAANEHLLGRFALGAAGIAFPWAGGLEHFKKEYAKKDPVAKPTGFKALSCKLKLHKDTAKYRTWAVKVFVSYTTWSDESLTTGSAPKVPTYGSGKCYDGILDKCLQFCYFFICYFAEDYNNFTDAYEGCKAKYREVFRIQAQEGGKKSIKRAKDIMEKQANQRWCIKKLTEGCNQLKADPQKFRHFLGPKKFLNDQYVEDLIKLFLSHEPHLDDYHPGPQDVEADRDWLDAILDWREHENTCPKLKDETKWLTRYEWDPTDTHHSINPGNQRTLAFRAKEDLVRTKIKKLWKKCKRTEDEAERTAAFKAYREYGEANVRSELATPKMKKVLRKAVPDYVPIPTRFIEEMDGLYKAACAAKDATELSAAYVAYCTHALEEPSYSKRPRPLLQQWFSFIEEMDGLYKAACVAKDATELSAAYEAYCTHALKEPSYSKRPRPLLKQWFLEVVERKRVAALSAPPGTPAGNKAYVRYRVLLKKLEERAFEDLELPEDLPETHQEWYDGVVALGNIKSTPVRPEEPKTAGDGEPLVTKKGVDTTKTPKKDDEESHNKRPAVVTPEEPLGPTITGTGPPTSMDPTKLGKVLDSETQPASESDDAPAVFLDKSKLADAYTSSTRFVRDPALGKTCANPKATRPGKVRFMEVEEEKKAQEKGGILPLSSFTEEERKQRIKEIQQGRTRLEEERLASAKKKDPKVTQVPPIVYPPIELFVIYGELHDKAEWDRKSEGWKHSFHHHTASEYDRGTNPYPKKHCQGTPFQRSIGYLYPKKHWDEVRERFTIHQTCLPTTDDLKNMNNIYWGSDMSADMVRVNNSVFVFLRSVLDLAWARGAYQEDHMICLKAGPCDNDNELTTMAVYVGICLGLFRPEWIEEASGDAAEESLRHWMNRPMRTGFTAYMEAFYRMAVSHEPEVKKIIYNRCLVGATADQDDTSLPPRRKYQCAVVQQAARRIYEERETEDEPDALKTCKTLQLDRLLQPRKFSRRGPPLQLLKAPTYQKKKRRWSDSDFSLEEHELDELAFKEKKLGKKQKMNDKVKAWVTEDTEMQEMTGWFETGEHGAHSRWDRSRGFFEKPEEAQPKEPDDEA